MQFPTYVRTNKESMALRKRMYMRIKQCTELAEHKEAEAQRAREASERALQEASVLEEEAVRRAHELEECRRLLEDLSLEVKVRFLPSFFQVACF